MQTINFMTPVDYSGPAVADVTIGQKITEIVDSYFYLGGKVARVATGKIEDGSEAVDLVEGNPKLWKTALKVVSYVATLFILPLFMLIAKIALRSHYRYHECTHQNEGPHAQKYEVEYEVMAPLTLIRSENPTQLKVSVIFNQQYLPKDPIVPPPSKIKTEGAVSKYTWEVITHKDNTLAMLDTNGKNHTINMIWWEALRKEQALQPVDSSQAALIKRSDLKQFLESYLEKMGVKHEECHAFVNFWKGIFNNNYDSYDTPFVLVQPIATADLGQFLPEMKVGGKNAEAFDLKRFYFRFEPTFEKNLGTEAQSYLQNLSPSQLGSNVVIDLGGEIAGREEIKATEKSFDQAAFNQDFIKKYIYAMA